MMSVIFITISGASSYGNITGEAQRLIKLLSEIEDKNRREVIKNKQQITKKI